MIRIVAEFGQTMEGDIGLAVEMVHAFADAGATGIKVQLLDPEKLATADAAPYWQTHPVGNSQRATFERAGVIPHDGWQRVATACAERHVEFIGTPFDLDAVQWLENYRATIKIASGDITYLPLLDAVRNTDRPVILSTGASTALDVDNAVFALLTDTRDRGPRSWLTLLACTLAYPAKEPNLGRIAELRHGWPNLPIGYSDHSPSWSMSFNAVLAGAELLEKHVTMRPKSDRVPDNAMGLDPEYFGWYVDCARKAEEMMGEGLIPTEAEQPARVGARRAARWADDVFPGHTVTADDFTYLRPDPAGDGLSILVAERLIGRVLDAPASSGAVVGSEWTRL